MARRGSPLAVATVLVTLSAILPAQSIESESSHAISTPYGAATVRTGLVTLPGEPSHSRRFVLRYPATGPRWNGVLVIGAHGGSGGPLVDAEGAVVSTSETALDDLIAEHVLNQGAAYASFDRDGIGGTREGLALTYAFSELARTWVEAAFDRLPARTYLVGFSMGGGITRFAAEDPRRAFDGVLIIAGAHGDIAGGLERQARRARLWAAIDPLRHPDVPDDDPAVLAYALAVGTEAAARPFWPFTAGAASAESVQRALASYGLEDLSPEDALAFSLDAYRDDPAFASRLADADTTGLVLVPTIEVVGTHDDLVRPEVVAYKRKVEAQSTSDAASERSRHRLYQVAGAWHISGDDDAIGAFQYRARQAGLEGTAAAMGAAPSFIPTVHEAFDLLHRWVADGRPPPLDRTVAPGGRLAF